MYEEIQPFLDKTSANLENGTCFIKSKSTLCMRLLTLEPDRPPDKIDPSLRTFYPKQGFTSSLARSLQPCANENFRHTQNPGFLPSLSSPKCWWTLAPHQGKPAPASLHFQVTGGPSSPALLLGMSGSFVCCLPKRSHGSKAGSQLTISNPLQHPPCSKESLMASPNHFSDGGMEGTKAGGQSLVDNCRNSSRKRGKSKEGGKGMKYSQNLVLNSWSKTRLLMMFLYLSDKKKRFYKMARSCHLFPPEKNCRSVLHPCTALPFFSAWSRQWLFQLKGEKQFIYITNTFMLGSTRLWDKVEGILCFIGDWNREKCFLLN